MSRADPYGQPIGPALAHWTARPMPSREPMRGRLCIVEPFEAARHGASLRAAHAHAMDDRDWTYLPDPRPADRDEFAAWCDRLEAGADPMHHAILDRETGHALGSAAFMRIDPANGVIEIGAVNFSPLLQRRAMGTEAIALMLRRAFDELGYRRVEWKCDALNAPSRAAAVRYGFRFEGVFRQAVVTKGRSRDTAWYAAIDGEWPALREALDRWLSPDNFDQLGRQRRPLRQAARSAAAATGGA